ncbi:MAG TPA: response regulator [Candidatus Krumholzibacteria bacterium]|jgi:CheY-like chemotaxis protein|nr:response regulator [Candidatus Krumholzibacteria bacterium]
MTFAHEETHGNAPTVLVVDDDELSRHVVACRLTRWGFAPVVFSRAEAVLQHLRQHDACALVSDLEMPEQDGLSLARAVRQLRPGLPILLLTARREPGLVERAREAGVSAVVAKQAGADRELRAALLRVLGPAGGTDFELAHSLRTPLTALKSAIDILCNTELPEAQGRFARLAQRNVDQMIVLVERLLETASARP